MRPIPRLDKIARVIEMVPPKAARKPFRFDGMTINEIAVLIEAEIEFENANPHLCKPPQARPQPESDDLILTIEQRAAMELELAQNLEYVLCEMTPQERKIAEYCLGQRGLLPVTPETLSR